MKIINRPQAIVTLEDAQKLLTKFLEKKTGKKITSIEIPEAAKGLLFTVNFEEEVSDFEEPKNA
jgi:hypothetical protein